MAVAKASGSSIDEVVGAAAEETGRQGDDHRNGDAGKMM